MDDCCFEAISSGCAIVGFFVGYGVSLGKKSTDLCASRAMDAECTINWDLMPPLCRPDDVDDKNKRVVASRRAKTEAADSSSAGAGDTRGDSDFSV